MNATAGDNKPANTGNNTKAANTAVPGQGDHDRVQMLSLRADGTPDQHNPEMIGDEETTRRFTREQFKQQAVSAADVLVRGVTSAPMMTVDDGKGGLKQIDPADLPQDPQIEAIQDEHTKVAKSAEKAADGAVDALMPKDKG